MKTQIISIAPDGALSSLQHRGPSVDLRQFGSAKISRATLIEWDEKRQAWFIRWFDSGDAPWTSHTFEEAGLDYRELAGWLGELGSDVVYFREYEEALHAEVAVLQALQLRGKLSLPA